MHQARLVFVKTSNQNLKIVGYTIGGPESSDIISCSSRDGQLNQVSSTPVFPGECLETLARTSSRTLKRCPVAGVSGRWKVRAFSTCRR